MKTELIIKNGIGKAENSNGKFTVLKIGGLYNLSFARPSEPWSWWVKENVKRLSTIQRYADNHGYDIEIKEV